jgi:hypothetical protein
METRAKSIMNHPYPEFDFDDASVQWRANKRRLPNGCYQYICMGNHCNRNPLMGEDCCKIHNKSENNNTIPKQTRNKPVGQKTI